MLKKSVEDFKQHVKTRNWVVGAIATLIVFVTVLNYSLSFFGYGFAGPVQNTTDIILFSLVAFFFAAVLNRAAVPWINKVMENAEIESKLLFSKLVGAIFFGSAFVVVLWRLGVTGQNIALVLGFTATGFALSIREFLVSYLAWFVLLTKKPFRINDCIRIEGFEGRVKHIGTFYVVLDETPETESDFHKIPIVMFIQKPVRNFQKGVLRDSVCVKVQGVKDLRNKMKSVEREFSQLFSSPPSVSIDVMDKEFVVKVAYTYELENKVKKRKMIVESLGEVFNKQPA